MLRANDWLLNFARAGSTTALHCHIKGDLVLVQRHVNAAVMDSLIQRIAIALKEHAPVLSSA